MCHFKSWADGPDGNPDTGTAQGPGNRGLVGMSEPGRERGLKLSVLWQEGQVGEMTFGLPWSHKQLRYSDPRRSALLVITYHATWQQRMLCT